MNSLFSKIASAATSSDDQEGEKGGDSSTGLFSSAKVVAEAAQNVYSSRSVDDVDKPKVAGAAEDLLNAASEYGNLKDNQNYGQYVEKAQTYLHSYGSDGSKTTLETESTNVATVKKTNTADEPDPDDQPAADDDEDVSESAPKPSRGGGGGDDDEDVSESAPKPSRGGGGGGGDDDEDVSESAPKPSRGGGNDDEEESGGGGGGGGFGGYAKIAQGFLQKD